MTDPGPRGYRLHMEKQVRRDTEKGTEFYPGHQIAKIEIRR